MFRYEAGKFKFDPLGGEVFPKVLVQLPADEVMLNILRMVDEWPEIEKKAPSPTKVLQKTGTLEKHGIELSKAHNAVYRLVDGTKSVQEIIDMSLVGKFATLEILASLLEGGDIKEVGIAAACLLGVWIGIINLPHSAPRLLFPIQARIFMDEPSGQGVFLPRICRAAKKGTGGVGQKDLFFGAGEIPREREGTGRCRDIDGKGFAGGRCPERK